MLFVDSINLASLILGFSPCNLNGGSDLAIPCISRKKFHNFFMLFRLIERKKKSEKQAKMAYQNTVLEIQRLPEYHIKSEHW